MLTWLNQYFQYEKHRRGLFAEHRARHWLKQQGLSCLAKRYRCACGEIDLIMQDQNTLVAVEVRLRTSQWAGGALESITPSKHQKLRYTLAHYRLHHPQTHLPNERIDLIAFDLSNIPQWIQNI